MILTVDDKPAVLSAVARPAARIRPAVLGAEGGFWPYGARIAATVEAAQ